MTVTAKWKQGGFTGKGPWSYWKPPSVGYGGGALTRDTSVEAAPFAWGWGSGGGRQGKLLTT